MVSNEFLNLYKELKSTEFGSWFQQYCTHVLSIDRNKRPLQISGKVAVG